MRVQPDRGPTAAVTPIALQPGPEPAQWTVTWRVENRGDPDLLLLAAWQPHGRFRWPERALAPPVPVPAGSNVSLVLPVRCSEPPGTVVENAFLILRALWRDEPWRILTRLRIAFDQAGRPEIIPELVTTQPVGFSC